MSKNKYNVVVLIGRFQPVHNAHIELLRKASEMADKVVIVVGSAHQPRTFKNPFTSSERETMIQRAIDKLCSLTTRFYVEHNIDTIYNNTAWATRVQSLVAKHSAPGDKIAIIGHEKDETSFYLSMFPQWDREEVDLIEPLHATDVRDLFFQADFNIKFLQGVVPETTIEFLQKFSKTEDFLQVVREREFITNYKKQFASLPYPPIFVTSDAVVIQSGHVLMVKRRSEPGRGLWALPGGFVNAHTDASVEDAAIRELKEETGIKVPVPVLRGNIKASRVFDAVNRSARGRTITHAFSIVLPDGPLPKVKGSDDAEKACWVPINDIQTDQCFEDHYEIVSWAIGGVS